ncbi:MAG: response regulator [Polyangiaceae bacterium]|jgi:two-component system phosphate regulon response regulator PhoB
MVRELTSGGRFARSPPPKYVPVALRNLVYRFEDTSAFARALHEGDQELPVPSGETVADGEWVLAIFEVGTSRRATASAARGLNGGPGAETILAFERRDWERLVDFAEAGSVHVRASKPSVPTETPTQPSLQNPPSSRRVPASSRPKVPSKPSFSHWQKSDPFAQGPSARVLLVDDDQDIREVVGAMLDAVGLMVEASTSAEEALEKVRRAPFDLLVLDWNLPGMTGIELCRLIRRDAKLSTLPVLFLTAHASSRDVVEAFASGADDYVVKPFRAPELGARIFGLLRRSRMGQAAQ